MQLAESDAQGCLSCRLGGKSCPSPLPCQDTEASHVTPKKLIFRRHRLLPLVTQDCLVIVSGRSRREPGLLLLSLASCDVTGESVLLLFSLQHFFLAPSGCPSDARLDFTAVARLSR